MAYRRAFSCGKRRSGIRASLQGSDAMGSPDVKRYVSQPRYRVANGWVERKRFTRVLGGKAAVEAGSDYLDPDDLITRDPWTPKENDADWTNLSALPSSEMRPAFNGQKASKKNAPRARIASLTKKQRIDAQNTACRFVTRPMHDSVERLQQADFLSFLVQHGELRFMRGRLNDDTSPLSSIISWMNHKNVQCAAPENVRLARTDRRVISVSLEDQGITRPGGKVK